MYRIEYLSIWSEGFRNQGAEERWSGNYGVGLERFSTAEEAVREATRLRRAYITCRVLNPDGSVLRVFRSRDDRQSKNGD